MMNIKLGRIECLKDDFEMVEFFGLLSFVFCFVMCENRARLSKKIYCLTGRRDGRCKFSMKIFFSSTAAVTSG